jgi:hypothetical protein
MVRPARIASILTGPRRHYGHLPPEGPEAIEAVEEPVAQVDNAANPIQSGINKPSTSIRPPVRVIESSRQTRTTAPVELRIPP